MVGRRLVIDSKKLDALDEAGRGWLLEMIAEGATIEDRQGACLTIPERFDKQEPVTKAGGKSPRRRLNKLREPVIEST